MNVIVVIPTYNERENIARLVPELWAQLDAYPCSAGILVVDDNSPDGTAGVVASLQKRFARLDLITGVKRGLGDAYTRGFSHALATSDADVLVEMDADLSHKPSDLPRLLAAIDAGADVAIGSRYVVGGSIPRTWAMHRKLISFWGNVVARYVTGLYGIRDCTAGFRAIRADLLRKIDLAELRSQGYTFQVTLLHAAVVRNARVVEIPVDFVDRTIGESKLGLRDILEFLWSTWWIRLNSSRVFIKFAIVGASGVAVNLATLTLLLSMGINKYIASPVAIEVSIISNFLLNNYWTFRWRPKRDRLPIRGLRFNAVAFLSLGISYTTFILLSVTYPGVAPQIHQLVGVLPAMLVNYFLNAYWTFTAPRAK